MIKILLATLSDALNTQKDYVNGLVDDNIVLESEKRFVKAIYDFIDFRVQSHFEDRRKHMSQERIAIADNLNSAIKATSSSIKSITALNSAPVPPTNASKEDMELWVKNYQEWYDGQRKSGISIM
jgi:hypothetical protein